MKSDKDIFDENDWAHFHDCIFYVTDEKMRQDQLERLFELIPEEMQEDAYEWGMNDTLWRDNFITWMTERSNARL